MGVLYNHFHFHSRPNAFLRGVLSPQRTTKVTRGSAFFFFHKGGVVSDKAPLPIARPGDATKNNKKTGKGERERQRRGKREKEKERDRKRERDREREKERTGGKGKGLPPRGAPGSGQGRAGSRGP